MDEQTVRKIIQEEMAKIFHSDKYHFSRDIQIANGRNIELGKSVGTQIATESSQRIGFYGATPTPKQAAIVAPNVQTGSYVQADAETLRSAITDIINRLQVLGFIS
jgi:hypothetical protein